MVLLTSLQRGRLALLISCYASFNEFKEYCYKNVFHIFLHIVLCMPANIKLRLLFAGGMWKWAQCGLFVCLVTCTHYLGIFCNFFLFLLTC